MLARSIGVGVVSIAMMLAIDASAADRSSAEKPAGSTTIRPPVPLDTKAMNTMLRADRDKDGTLSREEVEHYDVGLARRFNEVDRDRDGKLTLYEFEKLLTPQETASRR